MFGRVRLRGVDPRAVAVAVVLSLVTVAATQAPASAGGLTSASRASATASVQPSASISMSASGDLTISYHVDNVDPAIVKAQLLAFVGTATPSPTTVSDRIA